MQKEPRRKFKVAEVIAVLESTAGNKSIAATRLRCSRTTLDAYLGRYPEIAEALSSIKAAFIDYAESQLKVLVSEKNPQAVMFALRNMGRNRGYTDRREITAPPNEPVEFRSSPAIDYEKLTQDERRLLATLLARARGRPSHYDDGFVAKGILQPRNSARQPPPSAG